MDRPTVSGLVIALLLLASCAPANEPPQALCEQQGFGEELALGGDLQTTLDDVVAAGMEAMDAVGVSIAVQCAESPTYVRGYGVADLASGAVATPETVFEIGSITKQFVAFEILGLAADGRLSLDDSIGAHLPWLPDSWHQSTLRQLLSHTGGIPDHFAIFAADPSTPFDWDRTYSATEIVAAWLEVDDQLAAPPGTEFLYSSTGYAMLAAVIEKVAGEPFETAMERLVFEPMGLDRTSLCRASLPGLATGYNIEPDGPVPGPVPPDGFLSGGAGICSTVGDLIRWHHHLAADPRYEAMATPATLDDGTELPYGLGLHLDKLGERPAIFHEGGTVSFSSWLAYYPESGLTVAVLSNTLGPNAAAILELVVPMADSLLS